MTDAAYSMLVFWGLVSGPASVFIVGTGIIPVYLIFPVLAAASSSGRSVMRLMPLVSAPGAVLIWGLLSGDGAVTERAVRWTAAVVTGVSFSGALGASRASRLLFSLSRKLNPAGLTESLAMVVALAGPFSRAVRREFAASRKRGSTITVAFTDALSSLEEAHHEGVSDESRRSVPSLLAALIAWALLLGGIAGVL